MIVGGGPVGLELAGEIFAAYPDKKVTIVHSHANLLNNSQPPLSSKFTARMLKLVEQMGATVILDDRVNVNLEELDANNMIVNSTTYTTGKGERVEADLLVWCVGTSSTNLKLYRDSGWESSLCSGHLKCTKYLQVEGVGDGKIFALGDIADTGATKMMYHAGEQAKIVAKNLVLLEQGKGLKPYPVPKKGTMIVPLGPKGGAGDIGITILGSGMTSKIKGQDLFTKKVKKDLLGL
uniref:FAD/NAD(P)-binding domain-containing protein n=1 Tax=Fibrocapsa japonica TaxID=94617 RepID=A0A7S2V287_9STRA